MSRKQNQQRRGNASSSPASGAASARSARRRRQRDDDGDESPPPEFGNNSQFWTQPEDTRFKKPDVLREPSPDELGRDVEWREPDETLRETQEKRFNNILRCILAFLIAVVIGLAATLILLRTKQKHQAEQPSITTLDENTTTSDNVTVGENKDKDHMFDQGSKSDENQSNQT